RLLCGLGRSLSGIIHHGLIRAAGRHPQPGTGTPCVSSERSLSLNCLLRARIVITSSSFLTWACRQCCLKGALLSCPVQKSLPIQANYFQFVEYDACRINLLRQSLCSVFTNGRIEANPGYQSGARGNPTRTKPHSFL